MARFDSAVYTQVGTQKVYVDPTKRNRDEGGEIVRLNRRKETIKQKMSKFNKKRPEHQRTALEETMNRINVNEERVRHSHHSLNSPAVAPRTSHRASHDSNRATRQAPAEREARGLPSPRHHLRHRRRTATSPCRRQGPSLNRSIFATCGSVILFDMIASAGTPIASRPITSLKPSTTMMPHRAMASR